MPNCNRLPTRSLIYHTPSTHNPKNSMTKLTHHPLRLFAALACCAAFGACSEDTDNPKYASEPPVFTGFEVKPLDETATEVKAGERFVVTLKQSRKGKLLYAGQYAWEATSNAGDASHRYKQSVIYDQEPQEPTDTMMVSKAGTYKVTFSGKYKTSGQVVNWQKKYGTGYTTDFADGGKVTYTLPSWQYYTVKAEYTFTVR